MSRRWLSPLVPLYAAAVAWRNRGFDDGSKAVRRLRLPVVSIGNLSTGGTGKTPLTIALAEALARRGLRVDVLSRGYGRTSRRAARVDVTGAAEEFGDEPLLIARETGVPVYVARERYDAGVLAEAGAGVDVHLLDDGLQHRQLFRDVDILLMSSADWRDGLLPAGNLREPLRAARRASVIAIPADEPELEDELRAWGWQGPVWRVRRRMEVPAVDGPVAAFCGIARPGQFFAGLETAGIAVATRVVFRDHHRYTKADVERLVGAARAAGGATLVTTEKDLVRLGGLAELLPLKTAGLRIEIEDEEQAVLWLQNRLVDGSSEPRL